MCTLNTDLTRVERQCPIMVIHIRRNERPHKLYSLAFHIDILECQFKTKNENNDWADNLVQEKAYNLDVFDPLTIKKEKKTHKKTNKNPTNNNIH